MTQDRDLRLMLDDFFSDGSTRGPDRLMLVVADRIDRQRQRPSWLVRVEESPRRPATRPALVLVGILIVALLGATVFFVASPRPVPGPLPFPTALPAPRTTPPPIPLIQGNGELAPGRVEQLAPRRVVPVHTEEPEAMATVARQAGLHDDGEWWAG